MPGPTKSNVRRRSSTARWFIDGTLSLQISRSNPRDSEAWSVSRCSHVRKQGDWNPITTVTVYLLQSSDFQAPRALVSNTLQTSVFGFRVAGTRCHWAKRGIFNLKHVNAASGLNMSGKCTGVGPSCDLASHAASWQPAGGCHGASAGESFPGHQPSHCNALSSASSGPGPR
jgi:hypothetical protein